MKNFILIIVLIFSELLFPCWAANPGLSRQLIVVLTANEAAVKGQLQRYQRHTIQQQWSKVGEPISVVIAKNGLAPIGLKQEGDGRTPQGIYKIGPSFGFSLTPLTNSQQSYMSLKDTHICVDDVESMHYNQIVNATHGVTDWRSGEKMREIPLYKWGSVINYNPERIRGAGSCIFMHIWRNPELGTAGCVAMPEEDLTSILIWLSPRKKPIIALFTQFNYVQSRKQLNLPRL